MKRILLASMVAFGLAANADQLKVYDCKAPGKGDVTVNSITLKANPYNLVFNFPGYDTTTKAPTSLERTDWTNVPKALQGKSGGEYYVVKNGNSTIVKSEIANYEPNYAWVSNGILRKDGSGTLVVVYKRTNKGEPSTNQYQWARSYKCSER